jgi:omega-amidase
MAHQTLNITLLQTHIVWEDRAANLEHYEALIGSIQDKKEVVLLPEMFNTGFSMAPERLAEPMDGPTVHWMKAMAAQYRCILCGSLIIEENGKYFNRLLWVQPDGNIGIYDKRHLFGYAGEDASFSAGNRRLIAQVKGWRICLLVCYDLRFPVWARNCNEEYDVLVYVANWPERRSLAWKTLLQARAIENMSYVVGLNRVGKDGMDINYSGDSMVYGPLGDLLWHEGGGKEAVHTISLSYDTLQQSRAQFPFSKDADKFTLL